MKREILISGNSRETRVAILEDDRLVELLVDRPDARRSVGDIYLGKIDAVLPGAATATAAMATLAGPVVTVPPVRPPHPAAKSPTSPTS